TGKTHQPAHPAWVSGTSSTVSRFDPPPLPADMPAAPHADTSIAAVPTTTNSSMRPSRTPPEYFSCSRQRPPFGCLFDHNCFIWCKSTLFIRCQEEGLVRRAVGVRKRRYGATFENRPKLSSLRNHASNAPKATRERRDQV